MPYMRCLIAQSLLAIEGCLKILKSRNEAIALVSRRHCPMPCKRLGFPSLPAEMRAVLPLIARRSVLHLRSSLIAAAPVSGFSMGLSNVDTACTAFLKSA